jgi:hypothetical protein
MRRFSWKKALSLHFKVSMRDLLFRKGVESSAIRVVLYNKIRYFME